MFLYDGIFGTSVSFYLYCRFVNDVTLKKFTKITILLSDLIFCWCVIYFKSIYQSVQMTIFVLINSYVKGENFVVSFLFSKDKHAIFCRFPLASLYYQYKF